jgi:aldehyde dehydrogenase (NAD+)
MTAVQLGAQRYSGFNGQCINGSWRPGRRGVTIKDIDPYTGETLVEISAADVSDVDEAYESAAKAQPAWAARLPAERAGVLRRAASVMEARRDEIIDWLIRESGSARVKAELEWLIVHTSMLEHQGYAYQVAGRILPIDEPGTESRVYRVPVGVIGVISPWNWPLHLSHRSIGPAIALGNAVVVKPAADTPVTGALLLAKIYEEAGLPAGIFNVVVGKSDEIGDPFVSHAIPRFIAFTGSTAVGRHVGELAATSPIIKRIALELGGNSPLVVLHDADLDQAVPGAVFGRFLHQGQICMSANRIIVDARVHDEFVERFTAHARTLKYGNPREPDTVIGPIINQAQLKRMMEYIKTSRAAGARQLLGGDPQGLVLPPHVFVDVTNDMDIARHETFGPIAAIIKVRDEAEALRVANDTEFGLSSAVFTRDQARGERFALGLQTGMTHVNDSSVDDQPNSPFGGEKNSGVGRYGGEWIIEEFTTDRWITFRQAPRTYPF